MLDELLDYQRRIYAIMDRAEPILRSAIYPDLELLERSRGQVSAALTTYQLFTNRVLYPNITGSKFCYAAQSARALQTECISLGNDFRAHAAKWKSQDVAKRWVEYRPDALALITRVRAQMTNELREARKLEWLHMPATQRTFDRQGFMSSKRANAC